MIVKLLPFKIQSLERVENKETGFFMVTDTMRYLGGLTCLKFAVNMREFGPF